MTTMRMPPRATLRLLGRTERRLREGDARDEVIGSSRTGKIS